MNWSTMAMAVAALASIEAHLTNTTYLAMGPTIRPVSNATRLLKTGFSIWARAQGSAGLTVLHCGGQAQLSHVARGFARRPDQGLVRLTRVFSSFDWQGLAS